MAIKQKEDGFSIIELLLIIVVICLVGFMGWYVYSASKSADKGITSGSNTAKPDEQPQTNPYEEWQTCEYKDEGLTFRYPSDWKANDGSKKNPCNASGSKISEAFLVTSSKSPNSSYEFSVNLSYASQEIRFDDEHLILDVLPLEIHDAKKPLSLVAVARTNYSPDKVVTLVLTDKNYTVGQKVDRLSNVASQNGGKFYSLDAHLDTPGSQFYESLPLSEYKSHPEYNNVIKIFQSLSY